MVQRVSLTHLAGTRKQEESREHMWVKSAPDSVSFFLLSVARTGRETPYVSQLAGEHLAKRSLYLAGAAGA